MKKMLLAGLVLFVCALTAKADPPKKVNLSYDAATGKLKVEAIHPVKNVNEHFIDQIKVTVDGKEVKVVKLTKQSSAESEIQYIVLPGLKKGSEVNVKVRCNQFGTKSVKLTL